VFEKAVLKAEPDDNLKNRVKNLINSITFSVFLYTSRGLFEKHKIIFTAQVAFQVSNNITKLRQSKLTSSLILSFEQKRHLQ